MDLKRRGALFYIHFSGIDGRRYRLSTGESDETRARLRALEIMREHLVEGATTETARATNDTTLGMALHDTYERLWRGQRSSKEKLYLIRALARDIGHWPIGSVTWKRLSDYCDTLADRGDAPATRNRKMSAISTAMRECRKRGLVVNIPDFPHFKEDNIKERYLQDHEEAALLAHWDAHLAPADTEGHFMRALVLFLLDTGCRCGEALGVTRERDRGTAVWLPTGTTKSGKGRVIPLTTRARQALDVMLASPHHGATTDWAGRRFRTLMEHTGIEGVTLHTLRHTCATRLLQRGAQLALVSEWLGHTTLEMTRRYAHWATGNLEAASHLLGVPAPPVTIATSAHPGTH